MQARDNAKQQVLHEYLLPLLDSKLAAASAQQEAPHEPQQQQPQPEPLIDGRACAVIISSLMDLANRLKARAQMQRAGDAVLSYFLRPAVTATATPQGFGMLLGSAAKLRLRPSTQQLQQLLSTILTTAEAAQRDDPELIQPPHVSQSVWGVATMLSAQQLTPPAPALQQLLGQVGLLLTQLPQLYAAAKPVELCNLLSAFVIAECPPPPGLVADVLRGLASDLNLNRSLPRDLSRVLWCVARLDKADETSAEVCLRLVSALCRCGPFLLVVVVLLGWGHVVIVLSGCCQAGGQLVSSEGLSSGVLLLQEG